MPIYRSVYRPVWFGLVNQVIEDQGFDRYNITDIDAEGVVG